MPLDKGDVLQLKVVGLILRSDVGVFFYACSPCKKRFENPSELENHVLVHFPVSTTGSNKGIENRIRDIEHIKLEPEFSDGIESDLVGAGRSTLGIVNPGCSLTSTFEEDKQKEEIRKGCIEGEIGDDDSNYQEPDGYPTSTAYMEMSRLAPTASAVKHEQFTETVPLMSAANIIEAPAITTYSEVDKRDSNPMGNIKCDCCLLTFPCNGLRDQHVHKHVAPSKKCSLCPTYYPNAKARYWHQILHDKPVSERFHCHHCGCVLRTLDALTAHIHVSKEHNIMTDRPIRSQKKAFPRIRPQPPFFCDLCGQKFLHKSGIQTHLHQNCKYRTGNWTELGRRTCPYCGIDISYRHYSQHVQLKHLGGGDFMCSVCGKTFARNGLLNRHMTRRHNQDNTVFKCEQCGKEFSKKEALKSHLKITHSSERPHACTLCSKAFKRAKTLTAHLHAHNKGKQFKCRYCEKEFFHTASRYSHEKTKHQVAKFGLGE